MSFHEYSGDVTIRPSPHGITFDISVVRPLELKAKNSKTQTLTRLSAVLMLAFGLWLLPLSSSAATYSSQDIVTQTNIIRRQQGAPALVVNAFLEQAAQAKARDMFSKQYFDHQSPDGQTPWHWFSDHGYPFTTAGENLAIDFTDGQDILPAWMGSTNHRKNILNAQFHDVGIAVVDGTMDGTPTTVVVQFFGSQTSPSAAPIHPTPITPSPTVKAAAVTAPSEVLPERIPVTPTVPEVIIPQEIAVAETDLTPEAKMPVIEKSIEPEVIPTPAIILPLGTGTSTQIPAVVFSTFFLYLALLSGAAVIQKTLSFTPKPQRHLVSLLSVYN